MSVLELVLGNEYRVWETSTPDMVEIGTVFTLIPPRVGREMTRPEASVRVEVIGVPTSDTTQLQNGGSELQDLVYVVVLDDKARATGMRYEALVVRKIGGVGMPKITII